MSQMLPAEPLAKLVRAAVGHSPDGLACLSSDAGVSVRTLERMLDGEEKVQAGTADKVSLALGSHPALVWGMRWSV